MTKTAFGNRHLTKGRFVLKQKKFGKQETVYWVIKRLHVEKSVFRTDDGTLIIFSTKKRADEKRQKRELFAGVVTFVHKPKLVSDYGSEQVFVLDPVDGEVPEYRELSDLAD